ncbi:MAG: hypothetical protein KBT30_02840 [Clostridiales bacterium]|nr:hypothetical protein [Candidatus Apopatousia equi]
MKVKEIMSLTAKLLNEADLKKCIKYCFDNEMEIDEFLELQNQSVSENDPDYIEVPEYLNEQTEKQLRLILDCINIVELMISSEYKPLIYEEEIQVENCEFNIDNLSQKLAKIKQITYGYSKQNYELVNNKIIMKDGKYKIKYSYYPKEVDFDEEVDDYSGNLALLTFCYGVCFEYLLISGAFEEADMWKEKFEQSLTNNFRSIKSTFIKGRRWL